ncbi:hypothetical protein [Croceicoccus naphthovorans]|uniref:Uncharacterized protein n=1 Tax=Croceicoccus naphthovorans TaxID=1348774 RepID=A0A0G3XEL7_9SPHN|nr:hypothetical protein [Croceicoccus naphthovorans]AKM09019.1 hypothetical protein AB433_01995 [Croceicoccus naphthovorans]MBB3991492.1 hypothetical protein [Croceicoccus naphthovorans]
MASLSPTKAEPLYGERGERKIFLILAIIAIIIVAGFSVQLALGRSSFDVPVIYHIHAFVFFGYLALYLAQNALIAGNRVDLHRKLGWISVVWVPLMVVVGILLMLTVLQRTGGPFFFAVNVFLFSNTAHLLCFAVLTMVAVRQRRFTGWHRRLMLCGMAILAGPGLGRLIPLPFLIPYAWHAMIAAVLLFPIAGMVADKLRYNKVHPAWYWGIGAFLAFQAVADIMAFSDWGKQVTADYVAGTPGGQRPMAAFLPPGF